jgi:hypothetical protein
MLLLYTLSQQVKVLDVFLGKNKKFFRAGPSSLRLCVSA